MEDQAKTKRTESFPSEIFLQSLSGENKKTPNIGAEYSNDIDHKPGNEEVWLVLVYPRYGKNVADDENQEAEELTDHRDDLI